MFVIFHWTTDLGNPISSLTIKFAVPGFSWIFHFHLKGLIRFVHPFCLFSRQFYVLLNCIQCQPCRALFDSITRSASRSIPVYVAEAQPLFTEIPSLFQEYPVYESDFVRPSPPHICVLPHQLIYGDWNSFSQGRAGHTLPINLELKTRTSTFGQGIKKRPNLFNIRFQHVSW